MAFGLTPGTFTLVAALAQGILKVEEIGVEKETFLG